MESIPTIAKKLGCKLLRWDEYSGGKVDIKNYRKYGTVCFVVKSWAEIDSVLNASLILAPTHSKYIFRGQSDANWDLESSIARLLNKNKNLQKDFYQVIRNHLSEFKKASCGRRGEHPKQMGEEESWALGQHFGLATPLLDWTLSPYVALYFAIESFIVKSNMHALYCLNRVDVSCYCSDLDSGNKIMFTSPESDENKRLINQAGLFTFLPGILSISDWIKENIKEKYLTNTILVCIYIDIDENARHQWLRSLNFMNINQATLFPDLHGAAGFANIKLLIDNY